MNPPDVPNGSDWPPAAPLEVLRLRATILAEVRAFFARREVLEVDTPVLSAAGATDPQLASLTTRYNGPHRPADGLLYLQTSPEFHMKRLLAAGAGDVFQICKVFRDGEAGRLHNPEFTLLEWYRIGFDHHRLMEEVEEFARGVLATRLALGPTRRLSYREAFQRHAGLDPFLASDAELRACADAHGIDVAKSLDSADRDTWLQLLLSHIVEPRLGRDGLVFLYDYPASQAALARVRDGTPPLAERFELYLHGVELANGFHELGDAAEQRRRFEAELATRKAQGLSPVRMDTRLPQALHAGLPECAGVALGLDRLIMMAAGAQSIEEVIAFPIARA